MKKILAIAIALIMVMALSVSVFADEVLYEHSFDATTGNGWWNGSTGLSNDADLVAALQVEGAKLLVVLDAGAVADEDGVGWQVGFQTTGSTWLTALVHFNHDGHTNDGEIEGIFGAEDIIIDGDLATLVIDANGYYAAVLAEAAANDTTADTWQWINGASGDFKVYSISVVVPDAESDDDADADADANADSDGDNTGDDGNDTPADTGIALAVVPAVVAMAAVAVTKRR